MNAIIINQICTISKTGTCIMDMNRVAEKAKELGLLALAQLIESDLTENKITTGNYYPILKTIFGQ